MTVSDILFSCPRNTKTPAQHDSAGGGSITILYSNIMVHNLLSTMPESFSRVLPAFATL